MTTTATIEHPISEKSASRLRSGVAFGAGVGLAAAIASVAILAILTGLVIAGHAAGLIDIATVAERRAEAEIPNVVQVLLFATGLITLGTLFGLGRAGMQELEYLTTDIRGLETQLAEARRAKESSDQWADVQEQLVASQERQLAELRANAPQPERSDGDL